jgi:hypothetical protein
MASQNRTALQMPSYGRLLLILNAILAWGAVLLSLTLNLTGYYVGNEDPSKPTILGNVPGGVDTPLERFLDWSTYFTLWSNVVGAIVITVLLARPGLFTRTDRTGAIWRALRLDTVLMIIVTGVVYNALLASGPKEGWDFLSNMMVHIVMPIVTPLVWLVAGPRRLVRQSTIFAALVLPLIWAAYALIRGQVIGAYPYPFLDVSANGWVSVLTFIAVILVVAIVLGYVLLGLDRVMARLTRAEDEEA